MSVYASGGVKLYVGTATAFTTSTAYAGDTWTQVGEIEEISDFGDEAELIEFLSLTDQRKRKAKGVRDAGTIEVTVGRDPIDAGQVALRTAANGQTGRNIKIELTDKPASGASPKNTVFYCQVLVSNAKNNVGGVNDVTKQTFSLAITTEVLEVVASGS